ncbi:MAG: phospholipase D-like domain-containing protein [Verrucomicrobiales bacterium]|nr:phospholipase D-like domain-containing protein [Verrucomicrobiales bacterium]
MRETLSKIVGEPWTEGNRIFVLENGDQIFPAMLAAIEKAKIDIQFLTYVYWQGEIAEQFAERLAAKARDGVTCHVLIDAHGGARVGKHLLDMMEEAGVILAKYNPFRPLSPLKYQHRTHRKILTCDSEVGFIGGVGIADEWKGDARNPDERHEFHFQIEGPAVNSLSLAFRENWLSKWTYLRSGDHPAEMIPFDPGADEYFQRPDDHAGFHDSARMLPLLSSPLAAESEAGDAYRALIESAKESIRITSAYLIPDTEMIALLRRAQMRGVRVELVIPGPHRDSWLAQSRSRAVWEKLLEAGVTIHLYQPTMCHAKVTIIDNHFVTVGSINFDLLSFRLNEEANVIVDSESFASLMISKFEHDKARSKELKPETHAERSGWLRFKEKLSCLFPLPYWTEGCNY